MHTETYESSVRTRRIRRSDFSYVSMESGILAVQRRELIIEEVHKHFTLQLSSFSRSRNDRRSPPTTARPANADRDHGLIYSEELVTDRITIPPKASPSVYSQGLAPMSLMLFIRCPLLSTGTGFFASYYVPYHPSEQRPCGVRQHIIQLQKSCLRDVLYDFNTAGA